MTLAPSSSRCLAIRRPNHGGTASRKECFVSCSFEGSGRGRPDRGLPFEPGLAGPGQDEMQRLRTVHLINLVRLEKHVKADSNREVRKEPPIELLSKVLHSGSRFQSPPFAVPHLTHLSLNTTAVLGSLPFEQHLSCVANEGIMGIELSHPLSSRPFLRKPGTFAAWPSGLKRARSSRSLPRWRGRCPEAACPRGPGPTTKPT